MKESLPDLPPLLARRQRLAQLSGEPAFREKIARGADFLDRLLREDGMVYGVTTGYGDSCTVTVPPALVAELLHHLHTCHGCGAGRHLTPGETSAVEEDRALDADLQRLLTAIRERAWSFA